MEDKTEQIMEEGALPIPEVVEIIRSDQAVYISILVMILTAVALFYYRKNLEKQSKSQSLNIRYQFAYPKEKNEYEQKLLSEPDPSDFDTTAEFEARQTAWLKDISGVLMKRAIMSLSLNAKVTKDYSSYYMIYKSGVNLDIWQSVKSAKELVEKELKVIQEEAEWLKPGWGKVVFQQAQQLRIHMIRKQQAQMKQQQQKAVASS